MRLLLLGCSGFVGRELVPLLLELGHELTLVSRQLQPFPALVGERLNCIQGDPADPASWTGNGMSTRIAINPRPYGMHNFDPDSGAKQ